MTTVNTVAEHGGPIVLEEHSDSKTKVHGVRYSGRTKRTRDRTVFRVSLISPVLSTRWDETLPQLQTQSLHKNADSQQGGQKKSLLTLDSDDEEESSEGASALTQAQLSLMAKDLAPDWDSALVKQQLVRNALKSSPPDGGPKSSLTGLESELLSVMQVWTLT